MTNNRPLLGMKGGPKQKGGEGGGKSECPPKLQLCFLNDM